MFRIEEESLCAFVDKFVNDDYETGYGLLKGHYLRPQKDFKEDKNYVLCSKSS